jgi:hypothetical protein
MRVASSDGVKIKSPGIIGCFVGLGVGLGVDIEEGFGLGFGVGFGVPKLDSVCVSMVLPDEAPDPYCMIISGG